MSPLVWPCDFTHHIASLKKAGKQLPFRQLCSMGTISKMQNPILITPIKFYPRVFVNDPLRPKSEG